MLTVIEGVLSAEEVALFRSRLETAQWQDGAKTAGTRSAAVKRNLQVAEADPVGVELGNTIVRKVSSHPLFVSATLPEKIYPPRFNLYRQYEHYGVHVDAAIVRVRDAGVTIRADVSATLFLSEPDDYVGGELVIEGPFGAQQVKLAAGDLVLYPSTSLHHVTAVTDGERLAAIFWLQSAVPDERARALLFDLDEAIQALSSGRPADDPHIGRLTSVYHNLLRRWASV